MQTSLESINNPNDRLKLMSSKQIAERAGKDHSNVLRDIRVMLFDLESDQDSNLNPTEYQTFTATNGMTFEILLNERLSLCLASGYSNKLRLSIIDDWARLKSQSRKEISRIDLAKMVIEAEEEKEKLLLENSELKVKAEYTETVLLSDSCHLSSSIAKELGLKSAQELHKILNEKGILFNNGQMWVLYAKHSELGYTSTKTTPYYDEQGRLKTNTVTVWTEKGRQFLHSLFI